MTSPPVTSRWRSSTLVGVIFGGLIGLWGCEQRAGSHRPALRELGQLPPIAVMPVPWSVSKRARMLTGDADKALRARDCAKAASLAVQATSLDPSLAGSRLEAARVYARCGVPNTALSLLGQLVDKLDTCGGCAEAITAAMEDKTLASLWKTHRGGKLMKRVGWPPEPSAATRRWAARIASDLVRGQAGAFAELIHPREPWHLVRSCPRCADQSRRAVEDREFFGVMVARKLAMRFRPGGREFGAIPLHAKGKPDCAGRCCRWKLPEPIAVGEAALRTICLRPITRKQGALTRLEIVYGKPAADAEAEKVEKTEGAEKTHADQHKTILLPTP